MLGNNKKIAPCAEARGAMFFSGPFAFPGRFYTLKAFSGMSMQLRSMFSMTLAFISTPGSMLATKNFAE